jgi:hypothetical protein
MRDRHYEILPIFPEKVVNTRFDEPKFLRCHAVSRRPPEKNSTGPDID